MKTKALLLAGLMAASSLASLQAQTVYSVNAVGFVNTTLQPGFNLISNPLTGSDNTIPTLFPNVPNGTIVYKFNAGNGQFVANNFFFGWTSTTMTLVPGEGAFVYIPGASPVALTFVGEIPTGTLTTSLNAGFSIVSSQVPQAGQLDSDLGLPVANGDIVYRYSGNSFVAHNYFFGWNSPPVVQVGEAVFVYKTAPASWTRTFSVDS